MHARTHARTHTHTHTHTLHLYRTGGLIRGDYWHSSVQTNAKLNCHTVAMARFRCPCHSVHIKEGTTHCQKIQLVKVLYSIQFTQDNQCAIWSHVTALAHCDDIALCKPTLRRHHKTSIYTKPMSFVLRLHETSNYFDACATSATSNSPGGAYVVITQRYLHAFEGGTLMDWYMKINNIFGKSSSIYVVNLGI